MVAQAEIWLMETPNQKRRPVLVVSRDEVIQVLNNVVVAPVTSTVRNIPTCINVGSAEGLDHESVATFDNLAAVPKSVLTAHLGGLVVGCGQGAAAGVRLHAHLATTTGAKSGREEADEGVMRHAGAAGHHHYRVHSPEVGENGNRRPRSTP